MNWKKMPYWGKGLLISFLSLIILALIISIALSTSSLCGFNTQDDKSYTCLFSERVSMFAGMMFFLFVSPFTGLFYALTNGYSLDTVDGVILIPIILGTFLTGTIFGWLYGRIKNRNLIRNS